MQDQEALLNPPHPGISELSYFFVIESGSNFRERLSHFLAADRTETRTATPKTYVLEEIPISSEGGREKKLLWLIEWEGRKIYLFLFSGEI